MLAEPTVRGFRRQERHNVLSKGKAWSGCNLEKHIFKYIYGLCCYNMENRYRQYVNERARGCSNKTSFPQRRHWHSLIKNEQRIWIHIPAKKIQMANKHMKSPILRKYKSKLSWDTTPQTLEWLLSKIQKITSVDKDVEKVEPLCPVGGVVKSYSHCRKQYRGSSKN